MQVMTLIFTTIGSAADYGTFGRWLLLSLTVICWGAQYASMSLNGGIFLWVLFLSRLTNARQTLHDGVLQWHFT